MKLKLYISLGLLFFYSSLTIAQTKLDKLVEHREKLHGEWKRSENKKTGFFGNRTKADMTETIRWMERIFAIDNDIIEELNLIKEREKTEIIFEKDDYKFIAHKLERDVQILKRALELKNEQIIQNENEKRKYEWIFFILFLGMLSFAILWVKKIKVLKRIRFE
jgi:hypothetical protein